MARLGRPLPGRTTVVVTSAAGDGGAGPLPGLAGEPGAAASGEASTQVRFEPSVAAALAVAAPLAAAAADREVFVIGGA